jgi:hypothetical protein
MKRVVVLVGLGILVALGAGIYLLLSSLDAIVKRAIETYGTEILQTDVHLDRAEIHPGEGKGALVGLRVGNPEGFQTGSALELGRIVLALDLQSVTANPIVIREIVIERPSVTYEIRPGGSNLAAIQRNAQTYAGGEESSSGAPSPQESGDETAGRTLVIEDLYIRDGEVQVSAAGLQGRTVRTPLPEIHLTGIGREKGGATPAEVAQRILGAISRSAGTAVGALDLGGVLEGAQGAVKGTASSLGEGAKGAAESTREQAEQAKEKLRGLFR